MLPPAFPDIEAFTAISSILDNSIIFFAIVFAAAIIGEQRPEKLKRIAVCLAVAFLAAYLIKSITMVERVCATIPAKVECPSDFSFPSIHATLSFALAFPFLNKKSYPLYLAFALVVSFSRIYLGVHTPSDIAGGFVVAALSYYFVRFIDQIQKTNSPEQKTGKKGAKNG